MFPSRLTTVSSNIGSARYRDNRGRLTDILVGILGPKALLAAASIVVAILVRRWVPIFREHPGLLWAGMFWALAQATKATAADPRPSTGQFAQHVTWQLARRNGHQG
jgi:hypothetical protein